MAGSMATETNMTPEDIAHPLDESLGDIHEMALALAAAGQHHLGEKLAKAHETIQQYLIANDAEVDRAKAALAAAEAHEKALAEALQRLAEKAGDYNVDPNALLLSALFAEEAIAAYYAAHPTEKAPR